MAKCVEKNAPEAKREAPLHQDTKLGCENCCQPLGLEVSYCNGRLWHTNCVQCYNCRRSLSDSWFHIKRGCIFCGRCFKYMYMPRCVDCCRPIKENGITVSAMDVLWHEACFRCCLCRKVIKELYSVANKRPICIECMSKKQENAPLAKDLYTHRSPLSNKQENVTTARPPNKDDEFEFQGYGGNIEDW